MNTREWADARDAEWREALRRASLVAEVDVPDDDVDCALQLLGIQLRLRQLEGLVRHHPALLLIALTHAGMRGWEEGTFYSKVADLLGVQKSDVEDAVKGYHRALKKLGLPLFDDAKGMRWVTPVLLHGAVPLDHLDELLDLLTARRRRDPSLTGESFVEWARLQPHALATQPRALSRFLEFGGDFAPDFVGRVIDLADGNDVVLPRRSIERLRTLLASGRGRTTGTRETRPVIAMTPDNDLVVRLPAVRPAAGRTVTWRVHLGDAPVLERVCEVPWHERASRTTPETVPIGSPVRDVTVDRDGSSAALPFVRKEDPLLVFDVDGDLVPVARPATAGRLRVMWPGGDRLRARDGELRGRERDVPYGWEGWSLIEVDLDAGDAVQLAGGPWHRVAGADRARISVEPIIAGLRTSDGFEVSSERPVVELPLDAIPEAWTVTVADTDGTARAATVGAAHRVELPGLGDGTFVGDITVTVRGPLGRGLVRRVVVAEDTVAHAQPAYRPLAPGGGLTACRVVVRHAGRTMIDGSLGPHEADAQFDLGGQHLIFEVEHPELALVRGDVPGGWTSDPQSIETGEVAQYVLRARGLRPNLAVGLCLASSEGQQELRTTTDRRGRASFALASFAGLAKRSGSATMTLDDGAPRVPVIRLRPARLVSGALIQHGLLCANPEVAAPLEAVLYRVVAPWETGTVTRLTSGMVRLPDELEGRGTLRALFRVEDEWASAAAGPFPLLGADTVDLLQPWDPDAEPDDTRAISQILARVPAHVRAPLSEGAAPRVIEILATAGVVRDVSTRERLAATLRESPVGALRGIAASLSTTSELTAVIIECGLADMAVDELDDTADVERLLARSPLGAVLAASAAVRTPLGKSDHPGSLLAAHLGEDLDSLWQGASDDAKLGRLEPAFEERPELVKFAYDFLAPVPGLMLDVDTRIACVYELWQARSRLGDVVAQCMPSIKAAEKVVRPFSRDLWSMVDARLSRDGIIAVPALSIALALVSRLAAHHGGDATLVAANRRSIFTRLARRAPGLVAVDLVRADAAVIGASL